MADAPVVNVKKLKVAELKKELALRGLKVTGNKGELQIRLEEYFKLQGLTVAEGDPVEDDDDEDNDDDDDSSLEDDEDSSSGNQEEESPEEDKIPEIIPPAESKTEATEPVFPEVQADKETQSESETNGEEAAKVTSPLNRKIKIAAAPKIVSDVDLQRMKRFGEATAEKDKVAERAKRFGTNAVITSANLKASLPSADVEKLKKRAERFGAVSPAIVQLEDSAKLKKRSERFGVSGTDAESRKKLRAERFNLS